MMTSDFRRVAAALTAIFAAANLFAAVELLSPSDGAGVPLLPPGQKKIMALATYEDRLEAQLRRLAEPFFAGCAAMDAQEAGPRGP